MDSLPDEGAGPGARYQYTLVGFGEGAGGEDYVGHRNGLSREDIHDDQMIETFKCILAMLTVQIED